VTDASEYAVPIKLAGVMGLSSHEKESGGVRRYSLYSVASGRVFQDKFTGLAVAAEVRCSMGEAGGPVTAGTTVNVLTEVS
jgi:hypothetical protein